MEWNELDCTIGGMELNGMEEKWKYRKVHSHSTTKVCTVRILPVLGYNADKEHTWNKKKEKFKR
jgi:hypothetical protein